MQLSTGATRLFAIHPIFLSDGVQLHAQHRDMWLVFDIVAVRKLDS